MKYYFKLLDDNIITLLDTKDGILINIFNLSTSTEYVSIIANKNVWIPSNILILLIDLCVDSKSITIKDDLNAILHVNVCLKSLYIINEKYIINRVRNTDPMSILTRGKLNHLMELCLIQNI